MRPPGNWKPLVLQPISSLKRLPTSVPGQRTPLSPSLTFIWSTDNRKITQPSPPLPSLIYYSKPLLLNSTAGTHPVSRAFVVCLFWSGDRHTHLDTCVKLDTHTLINHSLWGTITNSSKNAKCLLHLSLKAPLQWRTTIHYGQRTLALSVLKIQTTCQCRSFPVMVVSWCPSVWTHRPRVNWWQPLGRPSDSGRVWASCSTDGPVIRRRDRQAHSFYSLSAPPVGLLTDRTALSQALYTHTDSYRGRIRNISVEWRSGGRVLLLPDGWVEVGNCLDNIRNILPMCSSWCLWRHGDVSTLILQASSIKVQLPSIWLFFGSSSSPKPLDRARSIRL